MNKKKIVMGIILIVVIVVVIMEGIHHYEDIKSQPVESSVNTSQTTKPYSHADSTNNDSNNMNLQDHFGKAINHLGL